MATKTRLRVFGGTPRPHVRPATGKIGIDGYVHDVRVWTAAQWAQLAPWERPAWSSGLTDGSRITLEHEDVKTLTTGGQP